MVHLPTRVAGPLVRGGADPDVPWDHRDMDDEARGEPQDDPRESAYELLQRGRTLLAGRHHAQAAIVLERADRLEPDKGSIVEALGRAYFNSGQHEPAREAFERLLAIDPANPYAHYALGQSLKRLGRPDEAGTQLRLAVAMDPRSSLYRAALARLGPAAAKGPRRRDADLEPAEAIDPTGPTEPTRPADPTEPA